MTITTRGSSLNPETESGLRGFRVGIATAFVLLLTGWSAAPLKAQEPGGQGELDRFEEECGDPVAEPESAQEGESRFSDQCIPLAVVPERPRALLELGQPFLGTGTIGKGFTLPTGAVWQPAFMAFGTIRTAIQGGRLRDGSELIEAVGRLDLFGNLYLTQTERVVVGFRPLDQDGRFTGVTLKSPDPVGLPEEFSSELNGALQTLFFEGDLGEIFPNLDKEDSSGWEVYFSVGRQPLAFQDGMLLDENSMDMLGLTRANVRMGGAVSTRITGVFGWGEVNRFGDGINFEDPDATLFGLFSEIDFRSTTLELDAVFVRSETTGDGIYVALGDTRRFGRFNNTFRIMGSFPAGDETPFNRQGVLIHNQFSWTPHHNHNFWYVSGFAGIGDFRSAARGPSAGGPLGRTGVLFAAPGIGRIGAPLGNGADDAVGGAIGHQMFFGHTRQQLIVEVGGRTRYRGGGIGVAGDDMTGAGFRFQAAGGRRFVFVIDGIAARDFGTKDTDVLGRFELVLKL